MIELSFVRKQATASVVAYYNALTYVTSYIGWQPDVCDALKTHIIKTVPGTGA